MINIDNTASGWHDFLRSLAQEAERDAGALDARFTLHGVLSDLANVARAYAGRLEIERGRDDEIRRATNELSQLVTAGASVTATVEPASPSGVSGRSPDTIAFQAPPLVAPPALPAELPDWLMSAIADMAERISKLEARVAELEAAPRQYVPITPQFAHDVVDVIDEDRTAWNTVDRARSALRGMVMREHRRLSASRQAILSRVASLMIDAKDGDTLVSAELRQHKDRAEELANIDAIMGVKLDEIAGIDDLLALREYDPLRGWPV